VAAPASLVSDTPHLREKTAKLGIIARACSIFGVAEIILYFDDAPQAQQGDMELCLQILSFIEAPQYLRKRMFKLNPLLKFTGILPPLQTPHHGVPASIDKCRVGDVREGIVVSRRSNSVLVDAGLERTVECLGQLSPGSRVTVRLKGLQGSPTGEIVERPTIGPHSDSEIPAYWGYGVRSAISLVKLLEDGNFDLTIGTSRYGSSIVDIWPRLTLSLAAVKSCLVVFGSPRMGLREILKHEGLVPEDVFDYFINTVPNQNVSTVRTEEAVLISLGLLNALPSLHRRKADIGQVDFGDDRLG